MQTLLNSAVISFQGWETWSIPYIPYVPSNTQVYTGKLHRDIWEGFFYPEKRKSFTEACLETWIKEIRPIQKQTIPVLANVAKLSKKAISVLGTNGLRRFEIFRNYEKGWDGKFSFSLSNRSIAVMEYFINQFFDFKKEPSLFLTRNGNLQLGWENLFGQKVELEFFPGKIEFYVEAAEEEGQVDIYEGNVNWLISILKENEY